MTTKGKAWMDLGLVVITAWVVITALKWPLKTALFPVVIGIPVFFMALLEFCLNLFGKGENDKEVVGIDFKLSEDVDPTLVNRRTYAIFLWIVGFFFMILLFGFPAALPIFFILFWKLYAKEGWGVSIGLATVAWLCFYGLFVRLLNIPFPEGWIFKGLRVIGMIG